MARLVALPFTVWPWPVDAMSALSRPVPVGARAPLGMAGHCPVVAGVQPPSADHRDVNLSERNCPWLGRDELTI